MNIGAESVDAYADYVGASYTNIPRNSQLSKEFFFFFQMDAATETAAVKGCWMISNEPIIFGCGDISTSGWSIMWKAILVHLVGYLISLGLFHLLGCSVPLLLLIYVMFVDSLSTVG